MQHTRTSPSQAGRSRSSFFFFLGAALPRDWQVSFKFKLASQTKTHSSELLRVTLAALWATFTPTPGGFQGTLRSSESPLYAVTRLSLQLAMVGYCEWHGARTANL
jgi:hypothetical protein